MHGGRVLDHHEVVAFRATEAELGDRGRAVGQQALLVPRVGQARATTLAPFIGPISVVAVDGVDEPLGDQSLLRQQRLKRRDRCSSTGGAGAG